MYHLYVRMEEMGRGVPVLATMIEQTNTFRSKNQRMVS